MRLIEKALWQVEMKLAEPVDLAQIAGICEVSPHHLSRVFRSGTGLSLMAYLRARRLTLAATSLADGRDDILQIALEAQFGSHAAFTRAFSACFGVLPRTVRTGGDLCKLNLMEPLKMDTTLLVDLNDPEIKTRAAFRVTGIGDSFTFENNQGIPALWQAFNRRESDVQAAVGRAAYGVCYDADEAGRFRYIAGVQSTDRDVPEGMTSTMIPQGTYAVFTHQGHIADLRKTIYTIWNKGLTDHGLTHRAAPDFEVYDKRFNPETGQGVVEIWIPVA